MMLNRELTVTKSIQIKADKVKVWAALTTPLTIRQYLYGAETITDWKVGSPIVFQGDVQGGTTKGPYLKSSLASFCNTAIGVAIAAWKICQRIMLRSRIGFSRRIARRS
jgi:hypothetical protein